MKKSLIALAVLAASGAAMAQSSVTLYGVADVWFGQTSTGVGAAHIKQTRVNSGGVNGSRWGLKGTEDLGGGLKANFVLEQGYNIDTGTVGDAVANAFNRQAFVGLSGGFGAVNLGRQYTAYDSLRGATNNTYDTAVATTGATWGNGVADYTSRVNNAIRFDSNTYGGFSGSLMVGLGEDKVAAVALVSPEVSATQNTSLHIKYAAGPLLVGYAYQDQTAQTGLATLAAGTVETKYNLIAGSYDFGVAKLVAGYNTAKSAGAKDTEYQLGVNFPVGTSANVAVGYTRESGDNAAGVKASSATGWSLAGYYDLSKRTALYAGYNKQTAKNEITGADAQDNSLMAVGVRHKF